MPSPSNQCGNARVGTEDGTIMNKILRISHGSSPELEALEAVISDKLPSRIYYCCHGLCGEIELSDSVLFLAF